MVREIKDANGDSEAQPLCPSCNDAMDTTPQKPKFEMNCTRCKAAVDFRVNGLCVSCHQIVEGEKTERQRTEQFSASRANR